MTTPNPTPPLALVSDNPDPQPRIIGTIRPATEETQEDIAAYFDHLAERARSGEIVGAAVALILDEGQVATSWTFPYSTLQGLSAVAVLQHRLAAYVIE